MSKQVVVINGGEAWTTYEECIEHLKNYDLTQEKFDKMMSKRWKDHLQENLGKDFLVVKLNMPNTRNSKYTEWKIWFEKLFPYLDDDAIFIGHSLGANFIAKYFAEHSASFVIGQIHLVAGCFGYAGGFDLPESLDKIPQQCDSIYIYHSPDDPVVPYDDALKYKKALPQAHLVTCIRQGHFLSETFPEIIENIQKQ